MTRPYILFALSAAGCLLLAVSALVSHLFAIGELPPFLYDGPRTDRLTTALRTQRIPVEFFGAAWFAAVALISGLSLRHSTSNHATSTWVFLAAIPAAGFGGWFALRHPWVLPVSGAALLSVALVIVASADVRGWREMARKLITDTRRLLRSPIGRATALGFFAVVLVSASWLQWRETKGRRADATWRSFRTWYAAQRPIASPILISEGGVRVVVLTDYQCRECLEVAASYLRVVEEFNATSRVAAELLIQHFPLQRSCNPGVMGEPHPVACDAAAAVALVRDRIGPEDAYLLGVAAARLGDALTPDFLRSRLERLGLGHDLQEHRGRLLERIRGNVQFGREWGIDRLPAVFVNGKRLSQTTAVHLKHALTYELAAVRRVVPAGSPKMR